MYYDCATVLLVLFEIQIGNTVIEIPGWLKATIGFSLPVMANLLEVVRGAVQSIPTVRWESAESLAFTRWQTMWMIILPQCLKRMIPPWMNWYAILTMATPLCYIIGFEESVNPAQQAMTAEDSRTELLAPFYLFLLVYFSPIVTRSRAARCIWNVNSRWNFEGDPRVVMAR